MTTPINSEELGALIEKVTDEAIQHLGNDGDDAERWFKRNQVREIVIIALKASLPLRGE